MTSTFPLDEATLVLLRSACQINPDSGHTELLTFLDMGSRLKSSTLLDDEATGGIPIYEVEFEEGFEPWHPNEVITALIDEVMRLREAVGAPGDR